MGELFDKAASHTTTAQQERADFNLGRQLFDSLRYRKTNEAFDTMCEIVAPHMKALGVEARIARILKALDPATENIGVNDGVADAWSDMPAPARSLSDMVYPKPQILPETGSDSNKQLAGILNALNKVTHNLRGNPVDALKPPTTGDQVLYLPENPDRVADREGLQQRLEQGVLFKQEVASIVKQELAGFLYDKDRKMSDELKFALYRMPEILEDGSGVARDISRLATDFSEVGYLVREAGKSLSDASGIVARPVVHPTAQAPIPPTLK